MASSPLTGSAACPVFPMRPGWGVAVWPCGSGELAGAGRAGGGWRAAGGVEEGLPFVFAVPAGRELEGDEAAAVPGVAGGDVDQVA